MCSQWVHGLILYMCYTHQQSWMVVGTTACEHFKQLLSLCFPPALLGVKPQATDGIKPFKLVAVHGCYRYINLANEN